MKCDLCGEENEILFPLKIVTSTEVRDERLCPSCFEAFMKAHRERKFPEIRSLNHAGYHKGICRACSKESKYLREIELSLGEHHRINLLCPYCIKNLRLLAEKGELEKYYPVFISGYD